MPIKNVPLKGLKNKSKRFQSKKSGVFTAENIQNFPTAALNNKYLAKVSTQ